MPPDDVVIPCDDRLVAERVRVVHALRHRGVHPVRHRERLLHGVEDREGVDFLGGLHLHAEEALEAGAARALGDRGRVARGLVVGERDAVHARGDGAADDVGRRHFERGARREAAVDVQVELHGPYYSTSPAVCLCFLPADVL